jgi:exo-1,4-beta-D-glucosaminidase
VSDNFYWLPARLSTFDWEKTEDTASALVARYEDLSALDRLPRVRLQASASGERRDGRDSVRVSLHNPSPSLAFQVHLGIRARGSDDEILPVLWEDNYVALLPGESREITARYLEADVLDEGPTLVVDGWNIERVVVEVSATATGH